MPPHLGIVDRIFPEDGYGFVLTDAGEQVYFHRNAVQGALDFEGLVEGDRVSLNLEAGDEGPQATVVLPAPPDAPAP
jgi:cold shock CspA family protein